MSPALTQVASASARIDQAVKDNRISAQMGDTLKSKLRDIITNLVNGTRPGKGDGFGFGRFGFGRP